MTAVFVIHRPTDAPPLIQCRSCGREERFWDEKQAARFKAAHAEACPQGRPTL